MGVAKAPLCNLGGLVLGHPLGFESAIALTLLCPFEALPALVAIIVASGRIVDDCSHRCLLFPPFTLACVMAKDDETAFLCQLLMVSNHCFSGAVSSRKWPTR
jgi:hypothetical protein